MALGERITRERNALGLVGGVVLGMLVRMPVRLVQWAIVFVAANAIPLGLFGWPVWVLILSGVPTLWLCVRPWGVPACESPRLRRCQAGCELLYAFLAVFSASALFVWLVVRGRMPWGLTPILLSVLVLGAVFWAGMLRLYLFSTQLGVKWRIIGAICGWIPVLNLVMLGKLLVVVSREVAFENAKLRLNAARREEQVCATRYPLLLVHGVFFRDYRYLNYWGRIPGELERNGATLFYGNHQSAGGVRDAGRELAARIRTIVAKTGCEKVNIIAHSKGGLDARHALSQPEVAPLVASLTTVSTPHRGCQFADWLMEKLPTREQEALAKTYNAALRRLGDSSPDFLSAVRDLTAGACAVFNRETPNPQGPLLQSVGSCLKKPSGGRFPLSLTNRFVGLFDGENDGLVGRASFEWGQRYQHLQPEGRRGISHGDMIDLNRENLPGFDVREFFVTLVRDLKQKGC
jgi:triacylglycerol lipase